MGQNRVLLFLVAVFFVVNLVYCLPASGKNSPGIFTEGATLPAFKMTVPTSEDMQKYLGVKGDAFTLNQVKANLNAFLSGLPE